MNSKKQVNTQLYNLIFSTTEELKIEFDKREEIINHILFSDNLKNDKLIKKIRKINNKLNSFGKKEKKIWDSREFNPDDQKYAKKSAKRIKKIKKLDRKEKIFYHGGRPIYNVLRFPPESKYSHLFWIHWRNNFKNILSYKLKELKLTKKIIEEKSYKSNRVDYLK